MHKEFVYKVSANYDNLYFPLKNPLKRRFGGFTAAQNQKWLIVCTVYVVDSVCIDFKWNLIIYTIPMEKSVKTGFLRRYDGKSAAVCASNSHPDLYQMYSIFIWKLKQCKLCIYRNIIEISMFFYKSAAMAAVGGGGAKLILQGSCLV